MVAAAAVFAAGRDGAAPDRAATGANGTCLFA